MGNGDLRFGRDPEVRTVLGGSLGRGVVPVEAQQAIAFKPHPRPARASQTPGPDSDALSPTSFWSRPRAYRIFVAVQSVAAISITVWLLSSGIPQGETPWLLSASMFVVLLAAAVPAVWRGLSGRPNDVLTIQEAIAVPLAAVAGPVLGTLAVHLVTLLVGTAVAPKVRRRLHKAVEHQSGRFLEFAVGWLVWRELAVAFNPVVAVGLGTLSAATVSWAMGIGSRICSGEMPPREKWRSLAFEFAHQITWLPALAVVTYLTAHHGPAAVLMMIGPVTAFLSAVSRDSRRHMAELLVGVDGLTGLPGQSRFYERLDYVLSSGARDEPVAVLLVDLDHFKRLNDSLGHLAGDDCLRWIARTLQETIREQDLVFRYGGEEFAAVLPGADAAAAMKVAERVRAVIEATGLHEVTASVGVSAMSSNGGDARALVEAADRALYEAKRGGRNQVRLAPAPQRSDPSL